MFSSKMFGAQPQLSESGYQRFAQRASQRGHLRLVLMAMFFAFSASVALSAWAQPGGGPGMRGPGMEHGMVSIGSSLTCKPCWRSSDEERHVVESLSLKPDAASAGGGTVASKSRRLFWRARKSENP